METLQSAQKQTTFANTLIQDMPTFNGSNSTWLEDWLIDIETAANLLDESRTKLAQAKSKGLTLTFIAEAPTSGKCWEEMRKLTLSKNLQFGYPYFSKPLCGHSAKGERIFSSLHTHIQKGSQKVQLHQQCSHNQNICKRS